MINKHKSNKIKENSNTVRHWNNGTDHRHSKSCCDKSSPARRTMKDVYCVEDIKPAVSPKNRESSYYWLFVSCHYHNFRCRTWQNWHYNNSILFSTIPSKWKGREPGGVIISGGFISQTVYCEFGCGCWYRPSGPRLNIKTVLSTYGDFHVKDKTAVRTSYL